MKQLRTPISNQMVAPLRSDLRTAVGTEIEAEHSTPSQTKFQKLDEAYIRYWERVQAGEDVDPVEYCAQHPSMQSSLGRLLHAHHFAEDVFENETPTRWPAVGETFLDYKLVLELGEGAFARVFLATETKLGNRLVAVKVSKEGGAAEATILGRIRHPNVVPVHSTSKDRETSLTLVCMPYVGSATLHDVFDILKERHGKAVRASVFLDAAKALEYPIDPSAESAGPARILETGTYLDGVGHIGLQIAQALAYIHERGIWHLDLKPSNVLLSPEGKPMLLDFNLSADSLSNHSVLGGTLPYMAPEQLRVILGQGDKSEIGARSDLFSFGVILYQLATGVHPFGPIPFKSNTRELATALLDRQLRGIAPVRTINRDVKPEFAALIERCLRFELTSRPQSAAEITSAIEAHGRPAARLRSWAWRNPKKVLASLLLCVAVCAAGATAFAISPTASERNFDAGIQAYQKGDSETAIRLLNEAIKADPTFEAAYFTRGRAYHKLGQVNEVNFNLAMADFRQAHKLAPNGRNFAALGYSMQCKFEGKDSSPLTKYMDALALGFANAELYNNIGYCVQKQGSQKSQESRKWFDEAIKCDEKLQVAYYNRAMLALIEAKNLAGMLEQKTKNPDRKYAFDEEKVKMELSIALKHGKSDFNQAVKLGPLNSDLLINSARFLAIGRLENPTWRSIAINLLKKGIDEYGIRPADLAKDSMLSPFHGDSEFMELTRRPDLGRSVIPAIRFVDPIKDLEF